MIGLKNLLVENLDVLNVLKKYDISLDDAIVCKDFPIKALSISKKSAADTMNDIDRGFPSKSSGLVEILYNSKTNQFIITDGYHRVIAAIRKKQKTIESKIWSTTYSDYYANVNPDDLLFEPDTTLVFN